MGFHSNIVMIIYAMHRSNFDYGIILHYGHVLQFLANKVVLILQSATNPLKHPL